MNFTPTRPASRRFFPDTPPSGLAAREWVERSANFVVSYCQLEAGDCVIAHSAQEHIIYLREGTASIFADQQSVDCDEPSVVIVPPGESRLEMRTPGRVLRVFAAAGTDLAARASNAAAYAGGAGEVAPAVAWPAPPDGFRLRCYRLADYAEQTMRVFRSTNLMINVFDFDGPRNPEALSPHFHEDFEQGSFAMDGEWVHSLRYPWSRRMSEWREDEHLRIGSPSVLVIPAGVIHTSRSISPGHNQLIDVFCPPRRDFVEMGFVCNEADYPPPLPIQALSSP